jgi:cytochrome c553
MSLRHALPRSIQIAALALVAFAFAGSAAAAKAGNAAAGKQKAAACAACHGSDGNKTLDDTYPRLAGQYPDYLQKALSEYRSGKRKNPVMGGQAQALSDEDIADLAAYFGSLDGEIHDLSKHAR